MISITLNSAAVASINAAISDPFENRWSLGGAFTTLDDDPLTVEAIFVGTSEDLVPLSETTLNLTFVPAPSGLLLLGLAMLPVGRQRRRVEDWSPLRAQRLHVEVGADASEPETVPLTISR